MSRAELRRKQRETQKANTATYNLTKAQLNALVEQQIGDRIKQVKEQATYDAVNTAMVLLLTLPLEVLWTIIGRNHTRRKYQNLQHMYLNIIKNGRTESLIWTR